MSTREFGDQLEKYILECWPEEHPVFLEPNSGAANNQNDLFTAEYSIEAKRTSSQAVSISGGVIRKARIKANRQNKTPLWIKQSTEGIFVICPFNEFCELITEAQANGQEED